MNKTILVLTSAVFMLAGCQDEKPAETQAAPDAPQAVQSQAVTTITETETIDIAPAEDTQAVSSAATSEPVARTDEELVHSARNSLDWEGTYVGTIPCASCTGIATSLTLNPDGTYTYEQNYLGQTEEANYKSEGEYTWNAKGDAVMLSAKDDSQQFFVGENVLMMLDVDGNRVQGALADNYNLVQQE